MQTVSETFAGTITVNRQMRLALPRMAMSLLIMSYLVADGVLISRFVGTTALSELSMSYPLTALLIAAGFMIAAGGGAVAARALGAQKHEEALRAFSTALTTNVMLGLTLGLLAWFGLDWVFELLGITPEQTEFARDYQRVLLPATPLFLAAATFEVFYTTSGRPKAGLAASAASGITNVVFDILFMGPLDMGMTGAAWATALSWLIGAACGLWYFMREKSPLKLVLHLPDLKLLRTAAGNGLQEFVSNLSYVVAIWLYNRVFISHLGTAGVAALTMCSFTVYTFNCVFHGFCAASSPILGFKVGAKEPHQVRRVFLQSYALAGLLSLASYLLTLPFARSVLGFFSNEGGEAFELAVESFPIYSLMILMLCSNMLSSSFFAAAGDGRSAAILAFARTLIFPCIGILILPELFGTAGLWMASPATEAAALLLSCVMFFLSRRKFGLGRI